MMTARRTVPIEWQLLSVRISQQISRQILVPVAVDVGIRKKPDIYVVGFGG
jgi:hypothetical protein